MGTSSAAVLNPFQSVRGVRHPFGEGRTPEVSVEQARQLLASFRTDTVFGLGDRVGAISRLRMGNLRDKGNHRSLQFANKGDKSLEIPVCPDLDEWIAGEPKDSGLFRADRGRDRPLTGEALTPHVLERMLKRCLAASGLPVIPLAHSFWVLVFADLLSQNVPLEDVQ